MSTRCGFVAVLGLPNAGKSTLVNALVGAKVSIVSSKVQTTRTRVLGIALVDEAQIILLDTPGIFAPKKTLEKAMVRAAWNTLEEGEIFLHIIDAGQKNAAEKNRLIIERLPKDKPCILVLNKVDTVAKPDLLELTTEMNALFPYDQTFMISALKQNGLEPLTKVLSEKLPQAPWVFPEDQITDMPMRLLAAEITREKIFEKLYHELPYAIFVETVHWENFDNGDVKIEQNIYVDRDSQKGIVLGKGGQQLKKIGQAARLELEHILETKVHLNIHVKQREDWAEHAEFYRLAGLEFPASN